MTVASALLLRSITKSKLLHARATHT